MHLRHALPWIVAGLISGALFGCGGNVEISTSSTGGGGTGGSGGDTPSPTTVTLGGAGGASTTTSATSSKAFCADVCASPAMGSCLPVPECEDLCNNTVPGQPPVVLDAFAKCVAEHPLCFESINGCLLAEMYGPDSLHEVSLLASGLGAYEGKILRVWHDPDAPSPFGGEGPIVESMIAFHWTVPFVPNDTGGPLLLMYIDMDDDGTCLSGPDVTHSVSTQWNGDLLNPVFTANVSPPLSDAPFVCDFQP